MIAKTRKASKRIAALLAATMVVTASPVDASAAAKPAWKAKKNSMTVGQKSTFKVKNIPSKGKVKFSSSKKKVATISAKGVVKAKKAGKTVIKAVVKNKKNKKVKTLSVNLKVKAASKTKATPTPVPSNVANINKVNVINNSDFTVTVAATIGGKELSSMLKADVESKLSGSKLTFTCAENKVTLTADYASYSADNNLITYKMDAASIVKLQPSKNNGKIGSADGTYTVTGTKVQVAAGLTTTYAEALVGNSVSGYIYDETTDEPIKNAKVTAFTSSDSRSDMTDANGYYYIPVTAGKCTVKAETVDSMKDAYFVTNTEEVKVSANNKTACNMYLELYNREEFFINGSVTNAETSDKVKDAVVTLYEVKADGKEEAVASIKTDDSGCFVFANSQARYASSYQKIADKYGLADKTARVKTFAYNEGLDRNKTYKVVIEKELSEDNITDVYEKKVSDSYQFENVQEWNLGDVKVTPIAQTKNIEVKATWEKADYMPTGKTADVNVKFCYETTTGVWTVLKEGKITVDVDSTARSFSYDLAAKKFFDTTKYPTLPTGKYYVVLDDNNKDTTIVTTAINLTAGSNVVAPEMTITAGKSTTVTISCTDKYAESLANIAEGGNVHVVKDNKGTLLSKPENVEVECGFYQKIGNDKIYIKTISEALKYSKANGATTISGTAGITRTIVGANYIVEPIQSYIQADNLSFTQADAAGDTVQLKCAGAANINHIKVDSEKLFNLEEGKTISDSFGIESIAVLDENDNVVGSYTYEEGTTVKKDELLSTGLTVPAKATAFKGLKPGYYKVRLDLVDFEPVVSNKFLAIDFESVTANIDNNINYTQKIAISGTITASGVDIQDKDEKTADALILLYDEKGVIVGATTYGTTKNAATNELVKKYAFVNGENAYLEAGKKYTLVVRSTHNSGQIAFETQEVSVTAKTNVKQNLEVAVGADGGITIGARDENNNDLKDAVVSLVDAQWSEFHSFKFTTYGTGNWIDSMIFVTADSSIQAVVESACKQDPNLVGIYPVAATEVASEWKIIEKLPANTYTGYITADGVNRLEIKDIKIGERQHYPCLDNVLQLTAGKNAVLVTLTYSHRRDVGVTVPFDMIEVVNSKGEIVVREYIPETTANKTANDLELQKVKILVPNVADTYTFKVYSNESFIGSQEVNVQGTATSVEVRLSKSATN